jgi:hypothetical protein
MPKLPKFKKIFKNVRAKIHNDKKEVFRTVDNNAAENIRRINAFIGMHKSVVAKAFNKADMNKKTGDHRVKYFYQHRRD